MYLYLLQHVELDWHLKDLIELHRHFEYLAHLHGHLVDEAPRRGEEVDLHVGVGHLLQHLHLDRDLEERLTGRVLLDGGVAVSALAAPLPPAHILLPHLLLEFADGGSVVAHEALKGLEEVLAVG